ncbi:MAG TPA: hypothetical protein VM284_06915 [Candidatus Limnocylindria bacterium]|nr:hypothetical protein [Candidatus Limnocylindria bacterium]
MRAAVLRLTALILPFALIACGGGSKATPTATPAASGLFSPGVVPTAEQLCALLTVDDWAGAGLANAEEPFIDDDGPGTGSAYCVYNGASGATGGLELDVFVGPTLEDAQLIYAQILESIPTPTTPSMSGVDEAAINTNIEPGFGAILVRAGVLVVTITLPNTGATADQLTRLTSLVLSRARSLQ